VTVTVAGLDFVPSTWLAAIIVIVAGFGRSPGAAYKPFASIVPVDGFPPGTPFTLQLTAWFAAPVTFAVNCCVMPRRTLALDGETLALTCDGVVGVVGVVVVELDAPPQPTSAVSPIRIVNETSCGTVAATDEVNGTRIQSGPKASWPNSMMDLNAEFLGGTTGSGQKVKALLR
jgi:hypothetical protein